MLQDPQVRQRRRKPSVRRQPPKVSRLRRRLPNLRLPAHGAGQARCRRRRNRRASISRSAAWPKAGRRPKTSTRGPSRSTLAGSTASSPPNARHCPESLWQLPARTYRALRKETICQRNRPWVERLGAAGSSASPRSELRCQVPLIACNSAAGDAELQSLPTFDNRRQGLASRGGSLRPNPAPRSPSRPRSLAAVFRSSQSVAYSFSWLVNHCKGLLFSRLKRNFPFCSRPNSGTSHIDSSAIP